jgi:hypothetical protein
MIQWSNVFPENTRTKTCTNNPFQRYQLIILQRKDYICIRKHQYWTDEIIESETSAKYIMKKLEEAGELDEINAYINSLPEYAAATLKRKESKDRPFEFIAPIIILEGMKFYDDFLLKGISK